jgi:NADH:ubiquinone oxidoreductase subunit 4 (subunit M)
MYIDQFYIVPTILMLIATVISLAYMLRFTLNIFLGKSRADTTELAAGSIEEEKIKDISNWIKLSFAILVIFVILIGIYPTFLLDLISTTILG